MARSIEQCGHRVTCINWNGRELAALQLYEQPGTLNNA